MKLLPPLYKKQASLSFLSILKPEYTVNLINNMNLRVSS